MNLLINIVLEWKIRRGLGVPTQQQQAVRFFQNSIKHGNMIADLRNGALKNIETTYLVDHVFMCGLATNWSSESYSSKNDVPTACGVFNTTGKGKIGAGDKDQMK